MKLKSYAIGTLLYTVLPFSLFSMHNKEAHIKLSKLYAEYACALSKCLNRPVSAAFLQKFDVPLEKLTCTQAEKTLIIELKNQIEQLTKEIQR